MHGWTPLDYATHLNLASVVTILRAAGGLTSNELKARMEAVASAARVDVITARIYTSPVTPSPATTIPPHPSPVAMIPSIASSTLSLTSLESGLPSTTNPSSPKSLTNPETSIVPAITAPVTSTLQNIGMFRETAPKEEMEEDTMQALTAQ